MKNLFLSIIIPSEGGHALLPIMPIMCFVSKHFDGQNLLDIIISYHV